MANYTLSPNMSLILPTIGQEIGPTYAQDILSSLSLIDQHTHLPGSGVPITPSAMSINSDLSFGGNNATTLRSLRLQSQAVTLSGSSDLGCLFVLLADLYYRDTSGNAVRLTQSGTIAGATGTISGLVSPASVTYTPATSLFAFLSAANTYAKLDASSVIIREPGVTSPKGVTLKSVTSLAADFSLTLPSGLPSTAGPVFSDASGNLSFAIINTTAKTGNYTLVSTDYYVLGDSSGGAFTFTLPSGSSAGAGKEYFLRKTDSSFNQITVSGTIDGVANTTLSTQFETLQIKSDGTNWITVSRRIPSVTTSYVPTLSAGFGTAAVNTAQWWREGDRVHIIGYIQLGTAASANTNISLPSGLTIDTAKIGPTGNTTANPGMRVGTFASNHANVFGAVVLAPGTSTSNIYLGGLPAAANALTPSNTTTLFASSDIVSYEAVVPISGWKG